MKIMLANMAKSNAKCFTMKQKPLHEKIDNASDVKEKKERAKAIFS